MLEVCGICKSYEKRQVLAPVSFSLAAGQCLGVTGGNGSGKSTLLKLMAQIIRPDSGDIRLNGRSMVGDRQVLRDRLGYVPQENDLFAELTVAQQLKLWQHACSKKGPLPKNVLERLGLGSLLNQRINTLSGGTQRRVSIAMAFLSQPDILIMDEATSGLDRTYSLALTDWMREFLNGGGRLIWCSHLPEEVQTLCHKHLHLQEGKSVWMK